MGKHEATAMFLSSVEASCCARQMRNEFWKALPFLLARRDQNSMYSIADAVSDIASERYVPVTA